MDQIYEYLKNNWIAISALIISSLSWITAFIVRKESSKLKLAEKRYDLRILLVNERIEYQHILNTIQSCRELLDKDIEFINQQISKNNEQLEDWKIAYKMTMKVSSAAKKTNSSIHAVQKTVDNIYEGMLSSSELKNLSEFTEISGMVDENIHRFLECKKEVEEIYETAITYHNALMELPI